MTPFKHIAVIAGAVVILCLLYYDLDSHYRSSFDPVLPTSEGIIQTQPQNQLPQMLPRHEKYLLIETLSERYPRSLKHLMEWVHVAKFLNRTLVLPKAGCNGDFGLHKPHKLSYYHSIFMANTSIIEHEEWISRTHFRVESIKRELGDVSETIELSAQFVWQTDENSYCPDTFHPSMWHHSLNPASSATRMLKSARLIYETRILCIVSGTSLGHVFKTLTHPNIRQKDLLIIKQRGKNLLLGSGSAGEISIGPRLSQIVNIAMSPDGPVSPPLAAIYWPTRFQNASLAMACAATLCATVRSTLKEKRLKSGGIRSVLAKLSSEYGIIGNTATVYLATDLPNTVLDARHVSYLDVVPAVTESGPPHHLPDYSSAEVHPVILKAVQLVRRRLKPLEWRLIFHSYSIDDRYILELLESELLRQAQILFYPTGPCLREDLDIDSRTIPNIKNQQIVYWGL